MTRVSRERFAVCGLQSLSTETQCATVTVNIESGIRGLRSGSQLRLGWPWAAHLPLSVKWGLKMVIMLFTSESMYED